MASKSLISASLRRQPSLDLPLELEVGEHAGQLRADVATQFGDTYRLDRTTQLSAHPIFVARPDQLLAVRGTHHTARMTGPGVNNDLDL